MNKKRFIRSTVLAWILFIGIDFLMHASILEKLWKEEIEAIKPLIDLAILIPVGYASFLLLTVLTGYLFVQIYLEKPDVKLVYKFSIIFGGIYCLSNLLAMYSYIAISFRHIFLYNLVYFIEIVAIVFVYFDTYYGIKKKRHYLYILYFLGLVIIGVILQNII